MPDIVLIVTLHNTFCYYFTNFPFVSHSTQHNDNFKCSSRLPSRVFYFRLLNYHIYRVPTQILSGCVCRVLIKTDRDTNDTLVFNASISNILQSVLTEVFQFPATNFPSEIILQSSLSPHSFTPEVD